MLKPSPGRQEELVDLECAFISFLYDIKLEKSGV
jgi:hypothetical protein